MKKIILVSITALFFIQACKDGSKEPTLKESSGRINTLSVVIEDQMWAGEVGDSIRKKLAAPVDGLPQEEPLFHINQYAHKLFDGFISSSRIALMIKSGEPNTFEIKKNEFAQPQTVIHLYGKTINDILLLLDKHEKTIIRTFKDAEIAENQRRINKSVLDDSRLKSKFGISLKIPSAYKYIIEDEKFVWIRKEIKSGNNSLMIYEVPIRELDNDKEVVNNIVGMRDSIGEKHIHGTLDNTFMVTEKAYAPYFFEIELNKREAYETKGTWELKNDFMAGPFINYAIKDETHNRYLVIEGFSYNPSAAKRDLMHELESIIKSVKFVR